MAPKLDNSNRRGAPTKLMPRSKRLIDNCITCQTAMTHQKALVVLRISIKITVSTPKKVRNVLIKAGYSSSKKYNKPILTERDNRNRLSSVLEYKNGL